MHYINREAEPPQRGWFMSSNSKQNLFGTMLIFHIPSISGERLKKKVGKIEADETPLAMKTLTDILKY